MDKELTKKEKKYLKGFVKEKTRHNKFFWNWLNTAGLIVAYAPSWFFTLFYWSYQLANLRIETRVATTILALIFMTLVTVYVLSFAFGLMVAVVEFTIDVMKDKWGNKK
ncbi:MAG: hypothetical protein V3U92_19550 [Cellulophaga sp.]